MTINNYKNQSGQILTWVLGFMIAISITLTAAFSVIQLNLNDAARLSKSQLSLYIADSGINYYTWHLNHANGDFKDGNPSATIDPESICNSNGASGFYGPFEHDYKDDNGNIVGTYKLCTKPKIVGSTIIVVKSIGETSGLNSTRRTVEAEVGAPSFSSYGISSNAALYFAEDEPVDGPLHSNSGIFLNGDFNDVISSSAATYCAPEQHNNTSNLPPSAPTTPACTDEFGNASNIHPGIWCTTKAVGSCEEKTTTNGGGLWKFPFVPLDFNQLVSDRCEKKLLAYSDDPSTSSIVDCTNVHASRTVSYIPPNNTCGANNPTNSYSAEAENGYLIELHGSLYDLYYVTAENSYETSDLNLVFTKTLVANDLTIPPSGVLFVEDNVWLRTTDPFSGRISIVASCQNETENVARIVQVDDIEYSAKDGSAAIGLMSQGDFYIAPYAGSISAPVLNLNAAIATSGSARFPYKYNGNCLKGGDYRYNASQSILKMYGSISLNAWRFTWFTEHGRSQDGDLERALYCNGASSVGFVEFENKFDYNFTVSPPPNFPVVNTYSVLRWREVLVTP